jgi:hypothetical protein
MVRWLVDQLQSLRTCIAVRLGLWRGQWRHGVVQVSTVVHPQCASQLAAQALESLRRAGVAVTRHDASTADSPTVIDYRSGDVLCLRRVDVPGLSHEWTGGPAGHPFCARDGYPLTELCRQFLSETGILPRDRPLKW